MYTFQRAISSIIRSILRVSCILTFIILLRIDIYPIFIIDNRLRGFISATTPEASGFVYRNHIILMKNIQRKTFTFITMNIIDVGFHLKSPFTEMLFLGVRLGPFKKNSFELLKGFRISTYNCFYYSAPITLADMIFIDPEINRSFSFKPGTLGFNFRFRNMFQLYKGFNYQMWDRVFLTFIPEIKQKRILFKAGNEIIIDLVKYGGILKNDLFFEFNLKVAGPLLFSLSYHGIFANGWSNNIYLDIHLKFIISKKNLARLKSKRKIANKGYKIPKKRKNL